MTSPFLGDVSNSLLPARFPLEPNVPELGVLRVGNGDEYGPKTLVGSQVRGQGGRVILALLERQVVTAYSAEDDVAPASPRAHLMWFCDALVLFFSIPWFCSAVLGLDNDFYYAIYIWLALTFLYLYVRSTNSDLLSWFGVRWRSSLFFGALASTYVVVAVLRTASTERPGGLLLVFEVFWRGVAYGIVHALVIAAFPLAVALGVMGGDVGRFLRRLVLAALTFVLVWAISAAYHLGFDQFDDDDMVSSQIASTAISLPAITTVNPIGSIAANTALHIVATVHSYESRLLVPPHVEHVPDYEPPGIFGPH